MQAIETEWKGFRFRSRTEARWAVIFEALGLDWKYEPQGYHLDNGMSYLPDFYLPDLSSEGGWWVEVKGQDPLEDEVEKARQILKETYEPF